MPKKLINGDGYIRAMQFDREKADLESRTIPVSMSSETPVKRWFGNEVLAHTAKAVDMSRAGSDHGLPLRLDHQGRVIGRVKNIRLAGRRLVGDATFSDNTKIAREAFADVVDGVLTDTSIMYDILDHDGEPSFSSENDDNTVTITRWMPTEAALVGVPADATVGAFRSKKRGQKEVPKAIKPQGSTDTGEPTDATAKIDVAEFRKSRRAAHTDGYQAGAIAGANRAREIIESFEPYIDRDGVRELRGECIDNGVTADEARRALLEYIAGDPRPVSMTREQGRDTHAPRHDIETIREDGEKWLEEIGRAHV